MKRLLYLIMSKFVYTYDIEHELDGWKEYDRAFFREQYPYLKKLLKNMKNKGIQPRVGESIYGTDDGLYYIKSVTHYYNGGRSVFWVNEDEKETI